MEIDVKKLVYHAYSNDDILISCEPIMLKEKGQELRGDDNLKKLFADDIAVSDIVISLRHQQTNENYAFLFIKTECRVQNILYTIYKAYIDEKLNEKSLLTFLSNAIDRLYRDDIDCQDYIEANGRYAFYFGHKEAAVQAISNEVINAWKVKTIGIESNPAFMEALNRAKEKM